MRALEDRWTTSKSEMITLTTMPTSTFHMIEKKKVRNMSVRSTHALILIYDKKLTVSRE